VALVTYKSLGGMWWHVRIGGLFYKNPIGEADLEFLLDFERFEKYRKM